MFFSKMAKESDVKEKFPETGVKIYKGQCTELNWGLVKDISYLLYIGFWQYLFSRILELR